MNPFDPTPCAPGDLGDATDANPAPAVTLATLAPRPLWVAWQTELRKPTDTKSTKLPYCPVGRLRKAMANNPATWGTRRQAEDCARRLPKPFGIGGIGIEFSDLGDGRMTGGLDLDRCRDPVSGEIAPWAGSLIDAFATYAEISPSQTGVKLFFTIRTADLPVIRAAMGTTVEGNPKHSLLWTRPCDGDHPPAIELHISNRYFTVTDAILPGCTAELRLIPTADLVRLIRVDGPAFAKLADDARQSPRNRAKGTRKTSASSGSDSSRSADAFKIGAEVRRSGGTYEAMCAAIRDDARTADWYREKGVADDSRELRRIWEKSDPAKSALILSSGAPLHSARQFLIRHHNKDGMRTLHHQNGAFFAWEASQYVERPPEVLRAELYRFLDNAKSYALNGEIVDFEPNRSKVANVQEATAAEAQLAHSIRPPAWLDGTTAPKPDEIIACKNKLLHLPTMQTRPHTPKFFTLNALDFDFDPNAPKPKEWLRFLQTIWPNDPQAIGTLQEIFGLCLTAETKYQKAFLIVGPKRSGKVTIARLFTQVLGAANVCGPTLSGVATNFGLQPLIGKRLAITGEDALTIDRKFRDAWTGRLDVRFLMLTNELPRLTDSSGALAGRLIILTMTRSFYGKEDLGLGARLTRELPGILLWAIAGWQRLTARGYFVPPKSSEDAMRDLADLGSPIGAFVRDRCIVGPGYGVRVDDLYAAWCRWCEDQGRDHPGTKQIFGRDISAAVPGLAITQPRDKDGTRYRYYEGITLDLHPAQRG